MFKHAYHIVAETIHKFSSDNVTHMAAALSYYALFAVPPILVLVLFLLNLFLPSEVSHEAVLVEVEKIFGNQAHEPISQVLRQIAKPNNQRQLIQVLGGLALFAAATGVLGNIQQSLNTIWGLKSKKKSLPFMIRERALSLLFIAAAGGFLLFSVLFSTLIRVATPLVDGVFVGAIQTIGTANFIGSLVITLLVVASIFRFIPSGRMQWRDILVGSAVTSVLYNLGKYIIAFYITEMSIGSPYGTAGSMIILLFWIYYSSLIFFFGAEFTYVFSKTHGSGVQMKNT